MPNIKGFYIHSESWYAKTATLPENLQEFKVIIKNHLPEEYLKD